MHHQEIVLAGVTPEHKLGLVESCQRLVHVLQGPDLIDLRQIFIEMAGNDFLASEATAASRQSQRSQLTSDFISVIPIIHVHIAYMFWVLLAASDQTASEVKSDLKFEISDLNYLHIHEHIA